MAVSIGDGEMCHKESFTSWE